MVASNSSTAAMASIAATKVMQITHIRELLQTYTDYPENKSFPDSCYLRGGWKLAHLSKLYNYDRSKLIGKVHEYSIDDFIAYLQLRVGYLLSSKAGESVGDLDEYTNKLTIDFPLIAKQIHAWTMTQSDVLVKSADKQDWKQVCFLHRLSEEIILIREGLLRSLRPGGQVDRIVRATEALKGQITVSKQRMQLLMKRIVENTRRAQLLLANNKLQTACEETLAYIATVRTQHGENLRLFFDAAVAKVQQQQEFVGKSHPPAPLPGFEVVPFKHWAADIHKLNSCQNRVEYVKRQVSFYRNKSAFISGIPTAVIDAWFNI